MYSKHTKLCLKKHAKPCVCVVPFLRILLYTLLTPKIINTKLYIHPKKPPILNYVAKQGNKLQTMKVLCPKSTQKEQQ